MRYRVPRAGVLPAASFAPLLAQTHLRFSSEFPSPGSPEVLHLLVISRSAFASGYSLIAHRVSCPVHKDTAGTAARLYDHFRFPLLDFLSLACPPSPPSLS